MGTSSNYGEYTPTACERFRDATGAHPVLWVAFVLVHVWAVFQ
jgi:hypothetical protein